MRAAVTAGQGSDADRRGARPGRAGSRGGDRPAGGGRSLRLGLPLLPRRPRRGRGPRSSTRASRGTRRRGSSRRSGPGCPAALRAGERVALWPLTSCGRCYPVPDRAAQRLHEHQPGRDPPGRGAPGAAARAGRPGLPGRRPGPGRRRADRARLDRRPGGRAGPDRGRREGGRVRRRPDRAGGRTSPRSTAARPCSSSTAFESRLERGTRDRSRRPRRGAGDDRWQPRASGPGGDGPEAVFEATGRRRGRPDARVELVAQAGRVIVVGLSSHEAPLRVGDLAFKEIDVLGVSCCNADEFAEAVVARRPARGCAGRTRHARVPAGAGARGDRLRDRASCGGNEGRDPPGGTADDVQGAGPGPRRGGRGALRADRPRLGPGRPGRLRRRAADRHAARRCATGALAAIDALAPAAAGAPRRWPSMSGRPSSRFVRALAIEAYYSDFVAPGKEGAGRLGGDRLQLAARDAPDQGLVVPGGRMRERFDVVVVGSGAGGGVVAGELAQRGRDVLLLETGPHLTAADFTRWEAKATHDLFWPLRLAPLPGGEHASRSSPAAASAGRRRSTRRWRCARTSRTSRSGTPRPV